MASVEPTEVEEFDQLHAGLAVAVADREDELLVAGRGGEILPPLETAVTEVDERRARRDLRRQIARMEAELGRLFGAAFPRTGIEWGVAAPGGPRVLGVAELEQIRDAMADRLAETRATLGEIAEDEQAYRELVEDIVADPASHKWVRVRSESLGEPSCRHWHVRPRWGVLGMLAGWWRVKLSSGCPLALGRGVSRVPKTAVLPAPA
ncbi:MAG: hypothetical protein QOD60_1237 [Solirubrobacterales bacterium]|jgi:hypothetical protein|nr:hypothetical protein [Solirubrobacterales bacterium]